MKWLTRTPIIYDSIYVLKYNTFVDIICGGSVSQLVKRGNVSDERLKEIWDDIMLAYSEAINANEIKNKMYNIKELLHKESKLTLIENILQVIQILPSEGLYNLLFNLGYQLPKLEYNKTNLEKVLNIFVGYYKLDRTNYIELRDKHIEEKKEGEYKQDYFDSLLMDIGIAFKMSIDTKDLTVSQFCQLVVKYKKYIETLSKKAENGR
jgi:hypothetical protein